MIGYCLGEVTMHNTTPQLGERISAYVLECLEATLTHFDTVIVIRPLPIYTVDRKSPPLNLAYQNLVQLLIEGAANQVTRPCMSNGSTSRISKNAGSVPRRFWSVE